MFYTMCLLSETKGRLFCFLDYTSAVEWRAHYRTWLPGREVVLIDASALHEPQTITYYDTDYVSAYPAIDELEPPKPAGLYPKRRK